jgi:hypothetical protein
MSFLSRPRLGALLLAAALSAFNLGASPAAAPAGAHLARGKSMVVTVVGAKQENETGITLRPGESYLIRPLPDQKWIDLTIPTTAAGFSSKTNPLMEAFANQRIVPEANWLELCGSFGGAHPFRIGEHALVMVPKGPPLNISLRLFANDVTWGYWDNRGSIKVEVKRLR